MVFVLNARAEYFRESDRVLTVPVSHESRLLAVIGARLLLYKPRDKHKAHFYGVARIADVVPSPEDARSLNILFDFIEEFSEPLILKEMNRLIKAKPRPFHSYSRLVWSLPDLAYDLSLERLRTSSLAGLGEDPQYTFQGKTHRLRLARIRSARVRNETFRQFGHACLFCGDLTPDLSGHYFGTMIIHMVPLKNGGPDSVHNTFPACGPCHFRIDYGVMGLDDTGRVLIAIQYRGSLPETLRCRIDLSPEQLWPKLEFIRWHRDHIFAQGQTTARYSVEPQNAYHPD